MTDDTSPNGPRLHGDMLTGTLLAFLKNSEAYGYELTNRLAEAGLPPFDSSAIYRTLRQLEATGLVSSMWDTSSAGPARRMYNLTRAGEVFLNSWLSAMNAFQGVLDAATGRAPRPLAHRPSPEESPPEGEPTVN